MKKNNFTKNISKFLIFIFLFFINQPLILAYNRNKITYNCIEKTLFEIENCSNLYISKKIEQKECIIKMTKKHLLLERELIFFLENCNFDELKSFLKFLDENSILTKHLLTYSNKEILNEFSNSILKSNFEMSLKIKKIINSLTYDKNRICQGGCLVIGLYVISTFIIGTIFYTTIQEDHGDHSITYEVTRPVEEGEIPLIECNACMAIGVINCPSCEGCGCSKCKNSGRIECPSCWGAGYVGTHN